MKIFESFVLFVEHYLKKMATLQAILKSKIGKGGKSKAYVADLLGVSEKTIENYMNGKRQPKPPALIKLSKALEFELSELSEQNETFQKIKPGNVSRVLGRVGSMNADDKDVTAKYIAMLEDQLNSRQNKLEKFLHTQHALTLALMRQVIKLRTKAAPGSFREIQIEVNKLVNEQIQAAEKEGIVF